MLNHTPINSEATANANTAANADTGAGRVTVIGGDALFRHGLEQMLTDFELSVIHEGDEPLDLAIVVADGLSPEALARVAHEMRRSGAQYVAGVLTSPSAGDLSTALRAGLDGLLSRSMSPEALRRSIELVLLGENVFPTRVAEAASNIHDEDDLADSLGLSVRDMTMLRLLAQGLSNRAISQQQKLPESTVKSQVRQALARIGAGNRTQAALWAIEHGLDEAPHATGDATA